MRWSIWLRRSFKKRQHILALVAVVLLISLHYSKSSHEEEDSDTSDEQSRTDQQKHVAALVVPYRDREMELNLFIPHITKYFDSKSISYKLYIIEQSEKFRFNRGTLINIGYVLSRSTCDYLIMHDVDLLPINVKLPYSYPGDSNVVHVASPKFHPRYKYKTFIGGILVMTHLDFARINGMSTNYWGWGLEDDELLKRIRRANLTLLRPSEELANEGVVFKHIHDPKIRKRDYSVQEYRGFFKQLKNNKTLILSYGLNTTTFSLLGQEGRRFKVNLACDESLTPNCVKASV